MTACGEIAIATPAPRSTPQELPDGTPIKGPDDLRQALLRRPEQFAQTFTEGLLNYATVSLSIDMPTVRRIVHGAAASDYKFDGLCRRW